MNPPTQEQIEAKVRQWYAKLIHEVSAAGLEELVTLHLTELAALQEQLDNDITSLQTQLNHERSVNDVLKIQNDYLRKQLAVARKDSERLDWIEANHKECRWMPISKYWYLQEAADKPFMVREYKAPLLRTVIDDAMEKGEE